MIKKMENYNTNSTVEMTNQKTTLATGVFFFWVCLFYLLYKMGAPLPWWLFSWPMILISVGVFQGIKSDFKNPSWLVLMLVGSVFLIEKISSGTNLRNYLLPIIFIAIGAFILLTGGRNKKHRWDSHVPDTDVTSDGIHKSTEDVIEAISIFGGTKRNIFSKNFRGGEAVNIFGGTDLNFMQADLQKTAVIECVNIFGGTKLVVPAHWEVRSEVISIMGGVDDKRHMIDQTHSGKLLIIKGINVFGGIDIKAF
jgi:predicted membrane protein